MGGAISCGVWGIYRFGMEGVSYLILLRGLFNK